MYLTCTIIVLLKKYNVMEYIFTHLMFRKPNKTTINKNKATNCYRSTSFRFYNNKYVTIINSEYILLRHSNSRKKNPYMPICSTVQLYIEYSPDTDSHKLKQLKVKIVIIIYQTSNQSATMEQNYCSSKSIF